MSWSGSFVQWMRREPPRGRLRCVFSEWEERRSHVADEEQIEEWKEDVQCVCSLRVPPPPPLMTAELACFWMWRDGKRTDTPSTSMLGARYASGVLGKKRAACREVKPGEGRKGRKESE